eukprot:6603493-Alexandrium_andersonii.AAC.1
MKYCIAHFRYCPKPFGAVSGSFGSLSDAFRHLRAVSGGSGLLPKLPESARGCRKLLRAGSGSIEIA